MPPTRRTLMEKAALVTKATPKVEPPIKWHGGKFYLAPWIVGLFPLRAKQPNAPRKDDSGWVHYVEPYFGGGAVLLANDPTGISEVTNDLDGRLINFFRVLQSPPQFIKIQRILEAVPFSEREWTDAREALREYDAMDDVQRAVKFFTRCRQSLAGRNDTFAPLSRNRTRRGMNEQASAWLNAIEGLAAVHQRLKRVVILNRPALEVIASQDGPRTLFYLDPPYLPNTRVSKGLYWHEMTERDHVDLLEVLAKIKGRFLLSGYRDKMYDRAGIDNGWYRSEFEVANHAAGGANKRRMVECLWTNFKPPKRG